ncbi:MAG: FAD-binding oxidoreductase [Candidatus Tectomicrobia bacterium]|nr:FAD-binding oxidoreductase [Candidatus Tectomicrobia bacterium]
MSINSMEIYKALAEIVGPQHLVVEPTLLEQYSRDGLNPGRGYPDLSIFDARPEWVVKPESTAQVSAIVCLAHENIIPLIPYGGATGLMGGAIPIKGGIVIDLKRMDRILRISPEDRTAEVQSGVVLRSLENELNKNGFLLGHDPWTVPIATIGGTISTNGLGYRGAKYGSMGDQVLGLEVVLPNGEVLRTRGIPKSSTGISLNHFYIGAEGSLGIVTAATIRVFAVPEKREMAAVGFPSFEAGFEAVAKMFHIGLKPALVDFGEQYSASSQPPFVPLELFPGSFALLYLVYEGFKEEVEAQKKRGWEICREYGGKDIGRKEADEFWETRHVIAERFQQQRLRRFSQEIESRPRFDYIHVALPLSNVLEYRRQCLEILRRHQIAVRECGLWTQPELFSIVMGGSGESRESLAKAIDEVLMLAQDLGGTMEYCHGVGIRLAHLMKRELGAGFEVMKALKQTLDPHNIMNPGKMGF